MNYINSWEPASWYARKLTNIAGKLPSWVCTYFYYSNFILSTKHISINISYFYFFTEIPCEGSIKYSSFSEKSSSELRKPHMESTFFINTNYITNHRKQTTSQSAKTDGDI